jgi:hypothetical protein
MYLAVGLPVVVNLLFNGLLFLVAFQRINRVEDKLDLLTGKVAEVDNRVIRIEDKLGIVPR